MELGIYLNNYLLIIVFFLLAIALPLAALSIGRLLRARGETEKKSSTYESGIEPFHDSRIQFSPRYYMFALLFVIFDMEAVFLLPWAVVYEKFGIFALFEMIFFAAVLFLGLIYAWRKKVLKWI